MIWLGLAVYQTDINCRAYKNCRQSQIFFKKNVAKLLTTKEWLLWALHQLLWQMR